MPTRRASAQWEGGLKGGRGTVSTESGSVAGQPYNFSGRFESGTGTNPEELVAAAHAACFAMAFSGQLEANGFSDTRVTAEAHVSVEKVGEGFTVTKSHLEVSARVPGADEAKFQEIAEGAKAGCPISRLLNAEISMNAKLEG